MSLSHDLSRDFMREHPKFKCFNDIINHLGRDSYLYMATTAQLREEKCRWNGISVDEPTHEDLTELLCTRAWRALSDFAEVQEYVWASDLERQSEPFNGKKPFQVWPSHAFADVLIDVAFEIKSAFPWLRDTPWFSNDEFEPRVLEILVSVDAYTRVLLDIAHFEVVDFDAVACTQIYMDVLDALDGFDSRGLDEVERVLSRSKQVDESVQAAVDLTLQGCGRGDLIEGLGPAQNRHAGSFLESTLATDQNKDGVAGWYIQQGPGAARVFLPRSLLCCLPLLPASISARSAYIQQCQAGQVLSEHGLILAVAHLYKAGRLSGLIHNRWEDMEFFIERQNLMGAFLRPGEHSLRAVSNQYGIALGLSVNQITGRKQPKLPSRDKVAHLRTRCLGTCRYSNLYMGLDRLAARIDPKLCTETRTLYDLVKRYGKDIKDTTISQQWLETRRLSASQLLQVATEFTIDDEPARNFNLETFQIRCFNLVSIAGEAHRFKPRWSKYRPNPPLEDLYAVAYDVLWEAAEYEALGRPMSFSMLSTFCGEANTMIASQGDDLRQRCFEVSSGHLSPDEKPSARFPVTPLAERSQVPSQNEDNPSANSSRKDALLSGRAHHRDEPGLHAEAKQIFAELTTDQAMSPKDAAAALEHRFDKEYKKRGITGRFCARIQDDVLQIETRASSLQGVQQMASKSSAEIGPAPLLNLVHAMERGIRYV